MGSAEDQADQGGGGGYQIALGGAATSAAVVLLNYVLGKLLDFDFLSLAVWFVVPVGAIAGGLAAASGYYFVAKWTHTMPSDHLRRDMIIIGGTTWFSYLYFTYFTMRLEDGTLAREYVTFWEYFQIQAEHTQLTFRDRGGGVVGTSGELGVLGYVREGLQAIGFLAGGLFMYHILGDEETCNTCRKYTRNEIILAGVTPAEFDRVTATTGADFPGLVDDVEAQLSGRPLNAMSLQSALCPGCGSRWLRPIAFASDGKQQAELPLRRYSVPDDLFRDIQSAAEKLRGGTLNPPAIGPVDDGTP